MPLSEEASDELEASKKGSYVLGPRLPDLWIDVLVQHCNIGECSVLGGRDCCNLLGLGTWTFGYNGAQ